MPKKKTTGGYTPQGPATNAFGGAFGAGAGYAANTGFWTAPGHPKKHKPGNYQPKPTTAPPPPVPPPPPDPAQVAAQVAAQRNLGLATADAAYATGEIRNVYGYDDKSNPFSRAAMLKESYDRQQLGTTNSYAAQGQLYSGAYGRMQGENTHQYAISDDRLRREYADQLRQVQRGQLGAYADYGTSVSDADWQRLLRAFQGG